MSSLLCRNSCEISFGSNDTTSLSHLLLFGPNSTLSDIRVRPGFFVVSMGPMNLPGPCISVFLNHAVEGHALLCKLIWKSFSLKRRWSLFTFPVTDALVSPLPHCVLLYLLCIRHFILFLSLRVVSFFFFFKCIFFYSSCFLLVFWGGGGKHLYWDLVHIP